MPPSTGSIIVECGHVRVHDYVNLPESMRSAVEAALNEHGLSSISREHNDGQLVLPQYVEDGMGRRNIAAVLGRVLRPPCRRAVAVARARRRMLRRSYPVPLDFVEVNQRASALADHIEDQEDRVLSILMRYETHEVAADETARALDLLRSLRENAEFFSRRVGPIATFLPINQPLYALTCFGIVPALLAESVYVRPPAPMRCFFDDLLHVLDLSSRFPHIHFSRQQRQQFVRERAAWQADRQTGHRVPITDAVIFTGTMANADLVRRAFHPGVLFIANGPGHNPVVLTETADLETAVRAVIRLQLYNQGQDCANPNSILVHASRHEEFVDMLRTAVKQVRVGPYADPSNRVGPITKQNDVARILSIILKNSEWLDPTTEGVIRIGSCMVEPTIMLKPLETGGVYTEHFAPLFFVQRYADDNALSQYFENAQYALIAMYVTVYGYSSYVESLVERRLHGGRILHDDSTILRNTHLHAPGVERGTLPYGGFGRGASSISIYGVITPKPTLPQRDIYEQLVLPTIAS